MMSRFPFRKVAAAVVAALLVVGMLGYLNRVSFAHWRTRAAFQERDWARAQDWLDRAAAWSPRNATTKFLLARLQRKTGRFEEAAQELSQAREWGYPHEEITREEWLGLAQRGQIKQVMPYLEAMLLDQRGDGEEICEAYVIGFIQVRQLTGAQDLLRAWIADHPKSARPLFIRASLYREFNRWEAAVADLRKAYELTPEDGDISLSLGDVLLTTQHPDEALQWMRIAERDPRIRLVARAGQMKCLRRLARGEEATQLGEKSLAENPQDPFVAIELARGYLEDGEFKRVVDLVRPLTERFPRDPNNFFLLGSALVGLGERDEGQRFLDRSQLMTSKTQRASNLAESVTPDIDTIQIRHEVGMLKLEYGSEAEGVIWLMTVLGIDPNYEPTLEALAKYYKSKSLEDPKYAQLAQQYHTRWQAVTERNKASESERLQETEKPAADQASEKATSAKATSEKAKPES